MKKDIKSINTKWLDPEKWTVKNNTARKKGKSDKGLHPSIIVGINGDNLANIGSTTNKKRGHHTNKPLNVNLNPKDKTKSYVRDDLEYHNKKYLSKSLKGYRVDKSDYQTILTIINKKK